MRVATYNINDVRKRIGPLLAWLDVTAPDVVCLQELKCFASEFPREQLRSAGYEAVVVGQKAWNGVAILAKGDPPLEIRRSLPGDSADRQARYLEAAVDGIVIGCCYMPNGNPQPGPKFAYKMQWFERFNRHAASLLATGHPVVLAGDFNVVPTDADIYATRSFKDNALLQPEPRAAYQQLLVAGWTDALSRQSPDKALYTFWSYLRNRWPRDAGMRIDHLLLNPSTASRMRGAGVDRAVRGMEGASDHAPAWVDLED
ncbi:exodeoxyribonuclease III [Variovorax saccharolyticus]|uniref:exodeoxyribonuclease III n=1 Tax=Variovorax saccharolyticus TaxID=3053516 RepID=UPI00257532C9|nr:exodeoxyribonuclease III [Variovorax sp. J31P216]MDM0029570.1 exodeoxyribonuclease III [Variovorax sp. J31P216]